MDRDEKGSRPLKVLKIKSWRALGVVSISRGYVLYVMRTYIYKFGVWPLQVVKIGIPTMINLWIRYGHGLIMSQLNDFVLLILCVLHLRVVGRVIWFKSEWILILARSLVKCVVLGVNSIRSDISFDAWNGIIKFVL